jgi:hypothetical protein
MDDKQIEKVQKEIETNVRKYCPHVFDDPETKIKDTCSLLDCHCVAIDSCYSFLKNKKSICKIYNDFIPKRKSGKIIIEKKRCPRCNKLYMPRSNHQKYCEICAKMIKRDSSRKWMQKNRQNVVI